MQEFKIEDFMFILVQCPHLVSQLSNVHSLHVCVFVCVCVHVPVFLRTWMWMCVIGLFYVFVCTYLLNFFHLENKNAFALCSKSVGKCSRPFPHICNANDT